MDFGVWLEIRNLIISNEYLFTVLLNTMFTFKSNKIHQNSEIISGQLIAARKEKRLKIEDIAKKLNINDKYLIALEKGEYGKLPKGIYGKNFLREYALFLGLNYNELAKIFDDEINGSSRVKNNELFSKQVVKSWHFLAVPKIVKSLIVLAITLICFGFLGIRINKIISPPELSIYSPADNIATYSRIVQVEGKTEKESQIAINGETVLSDKEGAFTKEVNLKIGVNMITITASKKYGRSKTVVKQVLVKE